VSEAKWESMRVDFVDSVPEKKEKLIVRGVFSPYG
jgi:hypothetical protein